MINKMILQGRLTADPELRKTQSDISVCSFTVAWSEKRNEIETKCFMRCTAWRGTAEFITNYFKKGQEIVVEGKMSTRDWTDNEGNSRTVLELTVETAHFCGSKASNVNTAPTTENAPQSDFEGFTPVDTETDLPF